MSAQILTYEEVSKHNTRNDLYMIIDKKVYDITRFLDEVNSLIFVFRHIYRLIYIYACTHFLYFSVKHPGGDEILIEEGAKDASEAFEDVGHSPDARDMLEKYYVGEVDPTVSFFFFFFIAKIN